MHPIARQTPLAAALFAAFAAPAAWSQQAGAPAAPTTVAAAATPAAVGAAEAAQTQHVDIQAEQAHDFTEGTTSLTKLPADVHDVPQSITVLSKSLLQSQGVSSLADALRNVPGITLGGAEGGQIGNNINLNGFTARTDIYLDGFRDRGQYYRDTFALDAVEVLMGPSSMLFGRGSTGGVINQVSKVPQLKPVTEVSASASTTGFLRTTADLDRPLDATSAVRIAAMAQEGAPTTRDVMKNRDVGVAPSVKYGIGTPTEITLSALLQRNHDMPDYGVSPLNGRPVPVGRDEFYGYKDDRTDQDVATFSALVRHRFDAQTVLRDQIETNSVHVDARETASQSVGLPDPTAAGNWNTSAAKIAATPLDQLWVHLQSHDRVINDRSTFNQTDLTAQRDTGSVHHELLAGAEIGQDTYANQAFTRTGHDTCDGLQPAAGYVGCELLTAPVHVDSPTLVETPGNLSTSRANSYGLYVGDTASIGAFKLVGGLRRDWFDATIHNTVTSATTPADVTQDVAFTSYRGGVIWQPTAAQSYYGSYSTSFDPSLEQLTNTTGATTPLPPESNKAWEAGGRIDVIEGKLSLNGAVFQITQYNARNQNSDGTYSATGTVRVRGVRAGGSGQPAKGWKIFAGAEYLDARIVDAIAVGTQGMRPLNTPKGSATLWTTYEFLPHWEAGGGAIYQSGRFMNNTDVSGVPGYARFDGTLAYRQHDYDVRLNVYNLFDRHYYDALIASDGGRAVPGSGRSAQLSVDFHI